MKHICVHMNTSLHIVWNVHTHLGHELESNRRQKRQISLQRQNQTSLIISQHQSTKNIIAPVKSTQGETHTPVLVIYRKTQICCLHR